MRKTDKQLPLVNKRVSRAHIVQSAAAGLYILIVFWIMHSLKSEMAVASLGASAFIAFGFPHADSARPRFLIGGYCTGAVAGLLCYGINLLLPGAAYLPSYIPACALAVFISMSLMTVLDFEHPAAAALAAAITISAAPFMTSLAAIGCVIVLSVTKELMKKHLRDL